MNLQDPNLLERVPNLRNPSGEMITQRFASLNNNIEQLQNNDISDSKDSCDVAAFKSIRHDVFSRDFMIRDERERLATNIYFVLFITFVVSLIIGVIFYSWFHDWEIATSFYFASQVLLGNM